MRTQINHNLKRLLSICIVLALLLSTIGSHGTIVYASETSFETAMLALNSNTVDDGSVELYVMDSVHYILIEDLCELVRCSWTEKNDVIWVTQGFWSATFNVKDKVFNDGYQTVEITILEVAPNKYAVPALMFLNYFKAAAFIENDTLYCEMPEFTAWEALNVDYANTLVDIYELYGGEGNVTFSLTLDIIMDFIMGDMSTSEDYVSDAFLTALKVDLYDYDSVQKYKETSQERLYSFLHSDKGEEFVEAVDDVLSVSAEPTQWYIQYYYNAIEKSFVNLAYDAFEAGHHTDVTHYGEKFYEAFTEKNNTSETAEKYFDNADYVMLFVSAAVDTAQQMKYTNATDNLIYNVMGQDNLNYLGISPSEDNGWFTVANRYKNVLGVAATQLEAEAMQLFTDKLCWETLIGTGVSSAAGISGGAWTFSLNFARLFVEKFPLTSSSVEAFKADRRALYLSELQQNVYWVAMNTLQDMQGQWDNPKIYTKYIQALQLYCRTSIAMYENLITMVDEFGQNRDYWTNLFQGRIDMLAVSLYQLTTLQDDGVNNCLPLELSSFCCKVTDTAEKRLMRVDQTDADGNVSTTTFTYNDKGLLISTTHTSEYDTSTYTYVYDEADRLIEIWSSFWGDYGPQIKYHYDANGYLVEISGIGEGGGVGGVYENDDLGRPVRYTTGGDFYSSVTEFTYSNDGRTISTVESSTDYYGDVSVEYVTYTYTYDAEGRMLSESRAGSDYSYLHVYSYDYKPFVAQAEEGMLPYHYSINDINGHEIWSLQIGIPETVETDGDGYIARIVYIDNNPTVINGKTYRNDATYEFFYDDKAYDEQMQSQEPDTPQNSTNGIKITEEEAYQIACDYWNYSEGDVSSETGFEMYVVPEYGEALKEDSKTGKYYYCYLLRWLVVDENGNSWMSTCDIVHIDAETGECTYFS